MKSSAVIKEGIKAKDKEIDELQRIILNYKKSLNIAKKQREELKDKYFNELNEENEFFLLENNDLTLYILYPWYNGSAESKLVLVRNVVDIEKEYQDKLNEIMKEGYERIEIIKVEEYDINAFYALYDLSEVEIWER